MRIVVKSQILCMFFVSFHLLFFGCGSGAKTEVSFQGKTIIVKGGSSHSTIQKRDALEIGVDSHHITVANGELTINGVSNELPDFKKMVLAVKGGYVRVELDGRRFPEDGEFTGGAAGDLQKSGMGFRQTGKKVMLPNGFHRAKGTKGSGQVLYVQIKKARSATRELARALDKLSTYFDASLTSLQGFRDNRDQQAQISFASSFAGHAIAGVAVSSVRDHAGVVGIVFDRSDVLRKTIRPLLTELESATAPVARRHRPQKVRWHTAYFPDGSGKIRLPQGWRITSSYQGGVDVVGTQGERMSLGIGLPIPTPEAARNPYTGTLMSAAVISYPTDPVTALRRLVPQMAQAVARTNPQSPRIGNIRVVEFTPVQSPTHGRAAFILYDVSLNRAPYRVLSFMDCSPAVSGYWTFYYSTVGAPRNQFATKLPIMMQAWSAWNVNPQVFQRRLNHALNSMQETHRLLSEANEYRQKTFDNTLADWTEVFRGSRIVRDTRTGKDHYTDIGWVDQTVQHLNERAGYQRFEQIPLRDLNW